MGLISKLKRGVADAQRLAGQPIQGSGGIVVTNTPQGRVVHNGTRTPNATLLRTAVIIDNDGTGSEEATNFTDERYYLLFTSVVGTDEDEGATPTAPAALRADPHRYSPMVDVATNLAEIDFVNGEAGTHELEPGTTVAAWQEEDTAGNVRWVFSRPPESVVRSAKITGYEAGGGKYIGRIWKRPTSDIAATGSIAESNLGTTGDTDIRIVNPAETDDATHLLRTGEIINVLYLRTNTSDGVKVYQVSNLPVGATDTPLVLGDDLEGAETADAADWARNLDNKAVSVYVTSRVVYNHAGDKKLYAFVRLLSFDATGLLYLVSSETQVEVDAAEAC